MDSAKKSHGCIIRRTHSRRKWRERDWPTMTDLMDRLHGSSCVTDLREKGQCETD